MSKLKNQGLQIGAVNVADDLEMANFLDQQMDRIDKKKTLLKLFWEARCQARQAATAVLTELQVQGDKYIVMMNGKPSGGLIDLCGFAYCYIPTQKGFSRRSKIVKELITQDVLRWDDYRKAFIVRLPYIDQSIKVNEAGANAASQVIREAGLETYVESRLD